MLEASADDIETTENTSSSSSSSSSPTKKTLTDDEVVSLATMFLLAGFETTGSTLAFTSYLLAINPDKQEKLCADIDAYFKENEVMSLHYLAVLCEYLLYNTGGQCACCFSVSSVSRLGHSRVSQALPSRIIVGNCTWGKDLLILNVCSDHSTTRYCKKTCAIGNLNIFEGAIVVVPIFTIHHSPENWEDPELFLPERWHHHNSDIMLMY